MVVEDADPRFATATSETPSRDKQEPQEAASGDEICFCRTFEIFLQQLDEDLFECKSMKPMGTYRAVQTW